MDWKLNVIFEIVYIFYLFLNSLRDYTTEKLFMKEKNPYL